MEKKILLVDDSALMRSAMSDIIDSDEQLTVEDAVGSADEVLRLIIKNRKVYDCMLVDVHMPGMDGVTLLKELRGVNVKTPVIMVSSVASESASEVMEALEIGAFDFVKKPTANSRGVIDKFSEILITKTYCACDIESKHTSISVDDLKTKPVTNVKKAVTPKRNATTSVRGGGDTSKLIFIASSTGGPKALQSVVPKFPANCRYPIVVVQHMPKGFTQSLAERLNELSPLPVKEVEDGEVLKGGCVYIAKGGRQCELSQDEAGRYILSEKNEEVRGGLRPCADIFLESLQDKHFDKIVCGVLTGMGADASKGIALLKSQKKNMEVVGQSKETCVVYGMPRAVEVMGLADAMVPLDDVVETMLKKIGV